MIMANRHAYEALAKVLDLPKNCVSFKLEAKAGELLTLTTTAYIDQAKFDAMATTLKKFALVEHPKHDESVSMQII